MPKVESKRVNKDSQNQIVPKPGCDVTCTAKLRTSSTKEYTRKYPYDRTTLSPSKVNNKFLHICLISTEDNLYYQRDDEKITVKGKDIVDEISGQPKLNKVLNADGKFTKATIQAVIDAALKEDEVIILDDTELYDENYFSESAKSDEFNRKDLHKLLKRVREGWYFENVDVLQAIRNKMGKDHKGFTQLIKEFNTAGLDQLPQVTIKGWGDLRQMTPELFDDESIDTHLSSQLLDAMKKLLHHEKVTSILLQCYQEIFRAEKHIKAILDSSAEIKDRLVDIFEQKLSELTATKTEETREEATANLEDFLRVYFEQAIEWVKKKCKDLPLNDDSAKQRRLEIFKSSIRFKLREMVTMGGVLAAYTTTKGYDGIHITYPGDFDPCFIVTWNSLFDPGKQHPVFWSDLNYELDYVKAPVTSAIVSPPRLGLTVDNNKPVPLFSSDLKYTLEYEKVPPREEKKRVETKPHSYDDDANQKVTKAFVAFVAAVGDSGIQVSNEAMMAVFLAYANLLSLTPRPANAGGADHANPHRLFPQGDTHTSPKGDIAALPNYDATQ